MCCGFCGCTRISYFVSNTLYVFEKLAACLVVTAMVTCIIVTMIFMISIGIGLGYNYCFVDLKTLDNAKGPDGGRRFGSSLSNDTSASEPNMQLDSNSDNLSADTRTQISNLASSEESDSSTNSSPLARQRRDEGKPSLLVAFLRSRQTASLIW